MSLPPQLDPTLPTPSSSLHFYLNGAPITLDASTLDPDATLLDFIRSQGPGLTGTKLGCGEGGCGACTVVLQGVYPGSRKGKDEVRCWAVNACLAPIVSVDGRHVITVEGLGDSEHPHPLQERMWRLSGSQCGFCTPGIIMSLYALLRNAATKGRLSIADVELQGALDGNLCRCTGYKPILDAAKTFVGEYFAQDKDYTVPINYAAGNLEDNSSSCCASDKPSQSTNPGDLPGADVSTDSKPRFLPVFYYSVLNTFHSFTTSPLRRGHLCPTY